MRTFRLTLEYDGTDFAGWQAQRDRRTVQGVLEEALAQITAERVRVVGAGRTDAGVHAEGQVASVRLGSRLPPGEFWRALNAVLPGDLAIRRLARAPEGFHARRDARAKHYRYSIWNGRVRSPLRTRRFWWVGGQLDLAAMRTAAEHLVGEHDFASFQSTGSSVATSVRALHHVRLRGRPRGELHLEVVGNGFLRHMVRALAGTLVEVGRGQRRADSLPGLLAAGDRSRAGATAPAHGLTLVRVDYAESQKPATARGLARPSP